MNLVGLIVASENVHDQVDAKPVCDLSLPLARKASANREHGRTVVVYRPRPCPIIAANDHGGHVVVEVAEWHPFNLFGVRRCRLDPHVAVDEAPRKILQKIECAGQNVVVRKRFVELQPPDVALAINTLNRNVA